MLFCGDIALPFIDSVELSKLPKELEKQLWIANLEGSLVHLDQEKRRLLLKEKLVFNDFEAIKKLSSTIQIGAFNLANNHILDVASIRETISNLNTLSIPFFGAGHNIKEAQQEIIITEDGIDFILTSFGWDAICCPYAQKQKSGVNPYTQQNVLCRAKVLKEKYPTQDIIFLFHWNYELEAYPQPMDRELAHQLIDLGISAVIGCHAHRVQPIEIYKGRPIVYSLGNFMFRHFSYMNGKLTFPPLSFTEYAIEIKGRGFRLHHFEFDLERQQILYKAPCNLSSLQMLSENHSEYKAFFKENRYQKKALPIFSTDDNIWCFKAKLSWVKARNVLVRIIGNSGKATRLIKKILTRLHK